MNRTIKIFYLILLFLSTFHFKAKAEPTFVQSKSIASAFYLGLNFNNDGTKMYTVNAGASDAVIEHILTTPYDICLLYTSPSPRDY